MCVCVGLPAQYRADGHISLDEPPPCVLERLCELHDGLVVEAKGIKQHYFRPYIQKLFHRQVNAAILTPFIVTSQTGEFSSCPALRPPPDDVNSCLLSPQILKGNEEHLTGMLDPQNFIDNK